MIKFYQVGGCVRDKFLGVSSKDIDFAVEAPSYEAMREEILKKGAQIFVENPEFLTIRGKMPNIGAADFVLCRRDGIYTDGRRPESVEAGTILDDLARRDFTVNAMAESEDGEILDPFGGKEDLERGVLRCVGSPEVRFKEDKLRVLRAVRFSIVKGFHLCPEIQGYISDRENLADLAQVSRERIYEELRKCFEHSTEETLLFLSQYPALKAELFMELGCGIKLSPRL